MEMSSVLAVLSMVGYVLGLGDRNPYNLGNNQREVSQEDSLQTDQDDLT